MDNIPHNLESPCFRTYRERVILYRTRCDFYTQYPDLPFSRLDKIGILMFGRWEGMNLTREIYSRQQCMIDAETPEQRAEIITAARPRIRGELIETGFHAVMAHALLIMFFSAGGYAAGRLAASMASMGGK